MPFSVATPATLAALDDDLRDRRVQTISPPNDLNAFAIAFDTAPMPPRAKPQAPIEPSTSPM